MSIHNGIGITSYSRTMDQRIAGSPAEGKLPLARTMLNPLNKQVTEFTVGGTAADGDYTFNVIEPDGTTTPVTFTRGSGETNDGISDGLLAQATTQIGTDLAGIIESAVDSDTNDLQVTFEHEGIAYTFTTSAPSGATLTATEITSPAGVSIPIGRFVADGGSSVDGQRTIALPSGVAETAILGVTMRRLGYDVNAESELSTAIDQIAPGKLVDVAREGAVNVLNVGADATANGSVFVVVNTAGGDELGEARGDDDGANSVELPLRNAYWLEDTPSGQVGPVYLRL